MPMLVAQSEPTLTDEDLRRFWSHVDRRGANECWPWLGACWKNGYGKFGTRTGKKKTWRVHKLVCIQTHGPLPKNYGALHTCDFRACCNPDHVYPGTQARNMRDMVERGRSPHTQQVGEQNGRAKLTWPRVRDIRARAGSVTQQDLAAQHGVSTQTISAIVCNAIWKEPAAEAVAR